MKIGLVVEGHGEVNALPVLIRKLAEADQMYGDLQFPQPYRLSRGKIVKKEELMRAVELMWRKVGDDGFVLVVFDADDDCVAELACTISDWFAARSNIRARLVIANREYEGWFIASIESLRGNRGISINAECKVDPDSVRDAKGWLGQWMTGVYSETVDQAAFSAQIDFSLAEQRSRSFRKFMKEIRAMMAYSAD